MPRGASDWLWGAGPLKSKTSLNYQISFEMRDYKLTGLTLLAVLLAAVPVEAMNSYGNYGNDNSANE